MAAKQGEKSKETRCRKNIATFLDLMGFKDDNPNVTTEALLQRLREIKEKQSRIKGISIKCNGKSSIIQQDPTTVLESLHSDDSVGNKTQVLMTEKDSRKNQSAELENPNFDDDQILVMNHEDELGDHGINIVGESSLRDFIQNVGGSLESMVLVMEKPLTKTDVNRNQGRLLMQVLEDKYGDFLTGPEEEKLGAEQDMEVWVFDPKFRKSTLNLRVWKMKCQQYLVLKTQWNQVVAANKLKENMVLQVWSFRVDEQLCFALVRVDDDHGKRCMKIGANRS